MFEFLEQMSGMEYMYVIMMVAGGTIFFIRLFLMFFTGIDADPSDAETSIYLPAVHILLRSYWRSVRVLGRKNLS